MADESVGPAGRPSASAVSSPGRTREPHWEEHRSRPAPGMTVLDGLWKVKELGAPGLAWRSSCRMGICGSCGMLINGRARLACNTQMSELGSDVVAVAAAAQLRHDQGPGPGPAARCSRPIASCSRTSSATTRRSRTNPTQEYWQSPHELEHYLQFSYCIKCGCCIAACPTMATDPQYAGPMPLGPGPALQQRLPRRRLRRAARGAVGRERPVALPFRGRVLAGLPQGRGSGQGDPAHEAGAGVRPVPTAPAPAAGRRWPSRRTGRGARTSRRPRRGP